MSKKAARLFLTWMNKILHYGEVKMMQTWVEIWFLPPPRTFYNLIDKTLSRLCSWLQVAEFWEVMSYVFTLTASRSWFPFPVYTQIAQICQYYSFVLFFLNKEQIYNCNLLWGWSDSCLLAWSCRCCCVCKAIVVKKSVGTTSAVNTYVHPFYFQLYPQRPHGFFFFFFFDKAVFIIIKVNINAVDPNTLSTFEEVKYRLSEADSLNMFLRALKRKIYLMSGGLESENVFGTSSRETVKPAALSLICKWQCRVMMGNVSLWLSKVIFLLLTFTPFRNVLSGHHSDKCISDWVSK